MQTNSNRSNSNRCRIALVAPAIDDIYTLCQTVEGAVSDGNVACVILPQRNIDEQKFQDIAMALVPIIQQSGAGAIIAGDTRIMGRSKADGLHVSGNGEEVHRAVEDFSPQKIVGGGNAKDRHTALLIGDAQPDYLFFGKLDGDIKPEAHRKNLALGEWWAEFVEIPCIIMAGSDPQSALRVAETRCDFVALGKAVFSQPDKSALKISRINKLLDEKAPRFES